MRGHNTLKLNHATMLAALDLWLADQFKNPPRAEKVTAAAYPNSDGFEVVVSGPAEVPE